MNSNIQMSLTSFQISIKPILQCQKFFIYNNEKFPFDFNLLKQNSSFFFRNRNQYEHIDYIYLLQESEAKLFNHISDISIKKFISLCQNEICEINNSDLYFILYLARKFEVTELAKSIIEIISKNCKELLFLQQNQSIKETNIFPEDFTDIIASNLIEFIKSNQLIDFPISILYQALLKYFKYHQNYESYANEIDQIIEFLFECLKKNLKFC